MSTCHVAGVIWILKASIGVITWFGCSRKSLHWNDSCPRLWPCRKRWRWRSKYPTPYKKEIDGTRLGLGLDMRRTKLQYQYAEPMQKCVATEGRSYQWQIFIVLGFSWPRASHTILGWKGLSHIKCAHLGRDSSQLILNKHFVVSKSLNQNQMKHWNISQKLGEICK